VTAMAKFMLPESARRTITGAQASIASAKQSYAATGSMAAAASAGFGTALDHGQQALTPKGPKFIRDKIDKAVPLLPAARAAIEMAKKANNTVAAAITPATTPTGSEQ
jgi:hypothetical protein